MDGKNVQKAGFSREGCCRQRGRVAVQPWRCAANARRSYWWQCTFHFPSTMPDQATAKKILQDLIKTESLGNKVCSDCANPNPQWASLRSSPFNPFPPSNGLTYPSALPFSSACNALACIEASVCMSGTVILEPAPCF